MYTVTTLRFLVLFVMLKSAYAAVASEAPPAGVLETWKKADVRSPPISFWLRMTYVSCNLGFVWACNGQYACAS
jgi:hypothetical protein